MWKLEEADYRKRVLGPAVEAFAKDGSLPDVFTLYALPFDVSNEEDIRKAIAGVRLFWRGEKQNIRYSKLISRLLDAELVGQHDDMLLKPAVRAQARAVAEDAQRKREAAKFKSFESQLAIVAAKGFLFAEDRNELLRRGKALGLTEAEIEARVGKVPLRASAPALPVEEGLPKQVRNEINSSLGVLGFDSLYAFLGFKLKDGDPPPDKAALRAAHQATEEFWRPKPADNRKAEANRLLGRVKVHLIDDDPARYEAARRWEAVETLRLDVELAASDGRIYRAEFEQLLRSGRAAGLDERNAVDMILALAVKLGAAVEFSAADGGHRCRSCFTIVLEPKGKQRCPTCEHPLWRKCPRCEADSPSGEDACVACGFEFDDAHVVALGVELGRAALATGRLEDAERHVSEAERRWGPGGEPAKLRAEIATRVAELASLRRQFDEHVSGRRLAGAKALLARLETEAAGVKFRDGRTTVELAAELETKLAALRVALERARALDAQQKPREAVLAYQEALEIAVDDTVAESGLRAYRPEPPVRLRAECRGADVVLTWDASPAAGRFGYVLVAREGAAPTSPSDGQVVCRTEGIGHRDTGVPAGVSRWYSLFAERGGVFSPPATAGPVLLAAEVADLTLEVGDRRVHGRWKSPRRGARVRVFRQRDQAPAAPGDGVEISAAGEEGFLDRDVDNDVIHYYRVSVEYQDANGHAVLSPGVVASARPTAPPPTVDALELEAHASGLRVRWNPPARGDVAILRAATAPAVERGRAIPTAQLAGLGARVPAEGAGTALDTQPPAGLVYYLAVTIVGDLAVPGAHRRFVAIPDVTNLKGQDLGRYLQLQWQWPVDCTQAVVTWRKDRPAVDVDDPSAQRRRVSLSEYELQGGVRIESPADEPHHVVVFAVRPIDGAVHYAPGIAPGARTLLRAQPQVIVSYAVARSLLGARSVTFRASARIESLPEVVIVANPANIQPRRIEDGRVVSSFSGLSVDVKPGANHTLKLDGLRRPFALRAFFRDPRSYERFRLVDPTPDQLEVR
ncbi:MAG: hypothetical protein HZA61_08610 [Candidatus Eisenbacteria bacterium]|uniref:SaeA second Fn3-like domain-containing protein n=1 Tax=Eiseniibacteriota bacterium TaxID=2212470 RepID=A0A933SBZ4_UNCEI|nr:hypothetical protein [Candidatus Eisenbacteria bacterium]